VPTGELRAIHLKPHLTTADVLTPAIGFSRWLELHMDLPKQLRGA
jgi:hypothetical protein